MGFKKFEDRYKVKVYRVTDLWDADKILGYHCGRRDNNSGYPCGVIEINGVFGPCEYSAMLMSGSTEVTKLSAEETIRRCTVLEFEDTQSIGQFLRIHIN